jgi:histidinol-phosphate phosphatase family protein
MVIGVMNKMSTITAAILAGGLGIRLRPVIGDRPKVLAPVDGRPFLAYLLDQLLEAGVKQVVLCTGYLGEKVQQTFGDYYRKLRLIYSQESKPLGTGGALRFALPLLDSNPVLVMNGDSYCQANLGVFLQWHEERRAAASLLLTYVNDARRYGWVAVNKEGIVYSFEEKKCSRRTGLINAGIYLISREVIESIPVHTTISLEHDVFPSWIGRGLYGYIGGGTFIDIGTPESYAAAQRFFQYNSLSLYPRRLVILDRDGTINVEKHYLSNPDEVELLPKAAEGIRRMRVLGLKVIVITNQSAIGRGYLDHSTLNRIHNRLLDLLATEGAMIDRIYFCPHRPDEGCECRKPKTALLEQAALDFQADLTQSFVIGDKDTDIEAGRRVGATTILVRSGYGTEIAAKGDTIADYVVNNLAEAAVVIEKLIDNGIKR